MLEMKLIGSILLALGIFLLIWGVNAAEAVDSKVARFFTGSPTNKTIGLVVGGVVSTIAGIYLIKGKKLP